MRYWQRWVKHCNIPPLYPAGGDPLGARAQAALLRGHRRDRRRDHHLDPRGARQRAHLGLPLLLAARRLLRARRLPPARPLRGARAVHPLPAQHRRRQRPTSSCAPLYRVDGSADLDERMLDQLARASTAMRPVRVGNGAALHTQHDIFGEMVLALAPIFLDDRFSAERSTRRRSSCSSGSARKAIAVAGHARRRHLGVPHRVAAADLLQPDVLGRRRPHGAGSRPRHLPAHARRVQRRGRAGSASEIRATRLEPRAASLVADLRRPRPRRLAAADGDPALLARRRSARCAAPSTRSGRTCRTTAGCCATGSTTASGSPTVAFIICTFWLVEALAALGRPTRRASVHGARARGAVAARPALGGLRDRDLRMWGNFPQAYSHVGLIHAAFAASPRWGEYRS